MVLVRKLVLHSLLYNYKVYMRYVKSSHNILADALSRGDFKSFFENAPETVNSYGEETPEEIWPITKFWLD